MAEEKKRLAAEQARKQMEQQKMKKEEAAKLKDVRRGRLALISTNPETLLNSLNVGRTTLLGG